jgi:hypothetical protein
MHKRNNTKTQYKQYKTPQIQLHILPKHPLNCQNAHTYTHTHPQVKTTTAQDTQQMKWSQYSQVPSV